MSIDVTIEQKRFRKQVLPLRTIIGDRLAFGAYEFDHLNPDTLGETDIVVFDPNRIGRGFSVTWTPTEKKKVEIRMLHPTTKEELRDFYDTVERIAKEWTKVKITVDGVRTSLSKFLSGFDDMASFNEKIIRHFCTQVIDGELDNLALYSAMWILFLEPKDAKRFIESPESFGDWLHAKQTAADVYNSPFFRRNDEEVSGVFAFVADCSYIMPKTPAVPHGLTFNDGKELKCDKWIVMLPKKSEDEDDVTLDYSSSVTADYSKFLDAIPKEKISEYDFNHILLTPFTDKELVELMDKLDEQGELRL